MAIGFIGLGIMGEGMAARLISEGVAGTAEVPLVVWNRTTSKCTGKLNLLKLYFCCKPHVCITKVTIMCTY